MKPVLAFESGTLTLSGLEREALPGQAARLFRSDDRTRNLRARACDYAPAVIALQEAGVEIDDRARAFSPIEDLALAVKLIPRPHQIGRASCRERV